MVWTGSKNSGASITTALIAAGVDLETQPLIETYPICPSTADKTRFERIDTYDWVIFSSAEAVRNIPGWVSIERARIAVVGPATQVEVERRGGTVFAMPKVHDAAALAELLIAEEPPTQYVLFVRGENARATLQKKLTQSGFVVEAATVYGIQPLQGVEQERMRETLTNADGLIMASPSGVKALVELMAPVTLPSLGCAFFCLGKTTQAALRQAGIDAPYPRAVTPDAVVEMLAEVFGA